MIFLPSSSSSLRCRWADVRTGELSLRGEPTEARFNLLLSAPWNNLLRPCYAHHGDAAGMKHQERADAARSVWETNSERLSRCRMTFGGKSRVRRPNRNPIPVWVIMNVGLERSWAQTMIADIPWQVSLFLDLFCATCGTAREASALTCTCRRTQTQQAFDDLITLFCWATSCKICKKDHRKRGVPLT